MAESWKRVAVANLNGREFSSPPFSMEFSCEFVTAGSPATGELTIHNPSDETIAAVERQGTTYPPFTFSAGYEQDSGLLMVGQITSHEAQWDGGDRSLKLKLMDSANLWNNARVSLSYSTPISAQAIITALLSQVGVTGAQIVPANNRTFDRYAVNTTFRAALLQLARETGSEVFTRQGQIYFRAPTTRDQAEAIVIESEEIIGDVEKTATGVKVRSLFNYRFAPGVFVDLQSRRFPGLYRVQKAKLDWTDTGDAGVEWEAKAA